MFPTTSERTILSFINPLFKAVWFLITFTKILHILGCKKYVERDLPQSCFRPVNESTSLVRCGRVRYSRCSWTTWEEVEDHCDVYRVTDSWCFMWRKHVHIWSYFYFIRYSTLTALQEVALGLADLRCEGFSWCRTPINLTLEWKGLILNLQNNCKTYGSR